MRITANQITIGRILLLPVPTAMLLFGPVELHFVALLLFIAIGLGDIFDGMLARKQGPTQFGAMLDPLADKIFIACIIVPFGVQGRAPVWLPAALLAREFIITGLRTQMTLRDAAIKTSVLAKLKTSIQMAGFGLVFLNEALPIELRIWVLGAVAAVATVVMLAVAVAKRRLSPFVWIPCGMLVLAFGVYLVFPWKDTSLTILLVILIFTWGSGIDYLSGAARIIRRTGLQTVDLARLAWTLSTVVVCTLIVVRPAFAFLVVIVLTAEFLIGGVDNLRALAGKPSSNRGYFARAAVLILLALGVHVAVRLQLAPWVSWSLAIGLTAVATIAALAESLAVRPLLAGKATSLAYSAEPPPRSASE